MKKNLALLIAVCMGITACGKAASTDTESTSTTETEAEEAEEETEETDAVEIYLGDSIETDKFIMNFKTFEIAQELKFPTGEHSTFAKSVEEGNQLALISGSFENNSSSSIAESAFDLSFIANDEYSYDKVSFYFKSSQSYNIDPLSELDFYICVEIPNKLVDIFETGKLNISFKDDLTVLTKIYDVSGNFTTDADYYYVLNCTQSGSAEEAADQTQATSVSESDESNATDKTEADTTPLNIGETIVTDNYEFTLNNVELTYEVKPSDTSSVYSSYTADDGKVYIDVSGSYYNTSKKDACVRDLPKASADYDNGYTYSGFAAVDTGNSFDWVSSYVICTPLETCRYHCIIECPEIVNSSNSSLYVLLPLADGNTYKYVIR